MCGAASAAARCTMASSTEGGLVDWCTVARGDVGVLTELLLVAEDMVKTGQNVSRSFDLSPRESGGEFRKRDIGKVFPNVREFPRWIAVGVLIRRGDSWGFGDPVARFEFSSNGSARFLRSTGSDCTTGGWAIIWGDVLAVSSPSPLKGLGEPV